MIYQDSKTLLEVRGLRATVNGIEILKGLDITVKSGEVHAIMGPNGSGKSTLAYALVGRDGYDVTAGTVRYRGRDLLALKPEERAAEGVFLAFQYPVGVPGVVMGNFLRAALKARRGDDVPIREFRQLLDETLDLLKMDPSFVRRYVNEGFSGGERKRNEVLQMAVLEPELAIMDETDSGLDIDALRIVADGVNKLTGPERGFLIITHYQRLLDYITPDVVHIFMDGRIVESGGSDLAAQLEDEGYDSFRSVLT